MRLRVQAFIIIATKGRVAETRTLLEGLATQTLRPSAVIVVGAEPADVAGLDALSGRFEALRIITADAPGAALQRNTGIRALLSEAFVPNPAAAFVAFFDDDFRPATDWLAGAAGVFAQHTDVVGLTGRVLADGVKGRGLGEAEARAYLAGDEAPRPHWASGAVMREVSSVYGCNMAFRGDIVVRVRFDENLPLYSWQEDRDYTAAARRSGRVVYTPACNGVHLGVKSARTSGLRFGYSQIANILYLRQKGSMNWAEARWFLSRALAANTAKSLIPDPLFDYRGRLRGNLHAIADLVRGRCHPMRILEMGPV